MLKRDSRQPTIVRAMRLTVAAVALAALIVPAGAGESFCAVAKQTSDGFVALRSGPASTFEDLAHALPSDFLYVGTEKCRSDFGKLHCSADGKWIFVESVTSKRFGERKAKGWASAGLIRQIACPDQ